MISNLNVSDTVEICITDKELKKHFFKTKIMDISLDNTFTVMVPTNDNGRPVIFLKEQPYDMFAHAPNGIFIWPIRYMKTEKVDNILACKFQAVAFPQVTQRREYFRQPVSINCSYFMRESQEAVDYEEEHPARILDLSGGGCSFLSNQEIKLSSKIRMHFVFRGYVFELDGEILDRQSLEETKADWDFRYRCKWFKVRDRVVDMLVKLVFDQQREMHINSTGGSNPQPPSRG